MLSPLPPDKLQSVRKSDAPPLTQPADVEAEAAVPPNSLRPPPGIPPTPPGRAPRVPFNDENRRIYCALLEHGFTKGKAARLIGVAARTIQHTVQRDPRLAEQVRHAILEFHAKSVVRVARAGKHNWRASAWLLERGAARRGPGRPRLRTQLQKDPVFRRDMKALVREVLRELTPNAHPPATSANGHADACQTDSDHTVVSVTLRPRGDYLALRNPLEIAQTKAQSSSRDMTAAAAQNPSTNRLPSPATNGAGPISAQNP
jgi:hypothetical protein